MNGNRARNPYRQDLSPGPVEIFAEAPDYESRAIDLSLAPGEHKLLVGDQRFQLKYRQRSGRRELIAASGVLGAFIGAAAVAAAIGRDLSDQNVSSVLLATGGGISGAALGILLATPLVPDYIPDNRALFIIGGMWIGAAEGFGAGVVGYQIATHFGGPSPPCIPEPCRPDVGDQLRAGFVGSIAGLGLGLTASALSSKHAPTYGRGWLIQSAAAGGAISGALLQIGMKWKPYGAAWQHEASSSSVRRRRRSADGAASNAESITVTRPCMRTVPVLQLRRTARDERARSRPRERSSASTSVFWRASSEPTRPISRTTDRPGSASCSSIWPPRPGPSRAACSAACSTSRVA